MRTLSLTAILAITVLMAASSASALVVDHFTNTDVFSLIVTGNAPGLQSQTDAYNAVTNQLPLGGSRTETLILPTFDTQNLTSGGKAVHTPSTNTDIDYSNDVNCASNLTLSYTFVSTNFTGSGQTALEILWGAADLSGETAKFTVTDSAGRTSTYSQTVGSTGSFAVIFPYASFTGSANFSALTALSLEIDSVTSGDYEIDAIQSVPEPATMSLLGFGMAGVLAWRRRKV